MRFLLLPLVLLSFTAFPQDEYSYPTQNVGYIYLFSTSDFTEAKQFAIGAADKLSTDYDSTLIYDMDLGLTDTTTCGCGLRHGYIPRGRFDEGDYVSIELSESYEIDTPGNEIQRYIVVVASYPSHVELLRDRIVNIRKVYPDARYFESEVYTGCMH